MAKPMSTSPNDSALSRRRMMQSLSAAGAALLAPEGRADASGLRIAGKDVEIGLTSLTSTTLRLTVQPMVDGKLGEIPDDGTLVRTDFGPPAATFRAQPKKVKAGNLRVAFTLDPPTFTIQSANGETIQQIAIDPATAAISFATGAVPILGLGKGGPQYDRRGNTDSMISGSSGYNLRNFGSHVPIPWLIGAGGWAIYVHQPYGRFDLTGDPCRFQPAPPFVPRARGVPPPPPPADISIFALPIDLFVVASKDPAVIMQEWARLTGRPEMPPLWSFGYQQSHRTLLGRDEILQEAKTFREKNLPCDAMIYLGTGFCPAGWNTNNGEFTFNQKVMPDPKAMFDQLHQDHFKVVLHVAYPTGIREMKGTVRETCDPSRRAETQASCYWDKHRPLLAIGVDGWWPDEGAALDLPSRLVRNRMYWDAYQLDRPNERPYALHRNGAAGMARYAPVLWSGDVSSMWLTLKNQVPIGINSGLSGIPLGHGHWRLRSHSGTHRGTLRPLVPVRRVLSAVPLAWARVDAAPAMRVGGRREWVIPWTFTKASPAKRVLCRNGDTVLQS